MLRPFHGQRFRQVYHPCLGDIIARLLLRHVHDAARHRCRVHDGALAALRDELPGSRLRHIEDAVQVGVHDLEPFRLRYLQGGFVIADARIVKNAVQPPELRQKLLHHLCHALRLRNVAMDADAFTAGQLNQFRCAGTGHVVIDIDQRRLCALLHQHTGYRLANAPRAACDDQLLACHGEHFAKFHLFCPFRFSTIGMIHYVNN